jgi:hypothetical protein
MANTFELISSFTVSTPANSITLSPIPATYTDLVLETSLRTDRADTGDNVGLRFNSSTSGYSDRRLYGSGTAAASDTGSSTFLRAGRIDAANNTASTFSSGCFYIPNYAGSQYKSVSFDSVQEQNGTNAVAELEAGLWSNTAAITSIQLYLVDAGFLNFVANSTVYLYGVKNA